MLLSGLIVGAVVAGPSVTLPEPSPEAAPAAVSSRVFAPRLPRTAVGPSPAAVDRAEQARELGLKVFGDGYVRERAPADRFDARIRADGTVVFDVDASVQVQYDGICAVAVCRRSKQQRANANKRRASRVLSTAAALVADAILQGGPVGQWGYGSPKSGTIYGGGRVGPGRFERPPIPVVTAVGRYGSLPSPVKAMSDFLDETFELRLDMATAHGLAELTAANARATRRLARIWEEPERSPSERRAAVLALWENAADHAAPTDGVLDASVAGQLDTARAAAADELRNKILASIAAHAPAGSPAAFTDAELARFNGSPQTATPLCPYVAAPACPGTRAPFRRHIRR